MKIVPLDAKRMVGLFAPGVEVPLAPFFGSMGVAPPPAFGRYDSAPPTINGGNMDDKALVAGTTLVPARVCCRRTCSRSATVTLPKVMARSI